VAGLSGALYAHYALFIDSNNFGFHKSIEPVLFTLLGGPAPSGTAAGRGNIDRGAGTPEACPGVEDGLLRANHDSTHDVFVLRALDERFGQKLLQAAQAGRLMSYSK